MPTALSDCYDLRASVAIKQLRSRMSDADDSISICSDIVQRLLQHIAYVKACEQSAQAFWQAAADSAHATALLAEAAEVIRDAAVDEDVQQPQVETLLHLCKQAGTSDRALEAVHQLLNDHRSTLATTNTGVYILRRHIIPAILTAMTSTISNSLNVALRCFRLLHSPLYRTHCMIECGLILENLLLPLLSHHTTPDEDRHQILDALQDTYLRSPAALVHLHYNYDNHSKSWRLFAALVETLYNVAQAAPTSCAQPLSSVSPWSVQQHATSLLCVVVESIYHWLNHSDQQHNEHGLRRRSISALTFSDMHEPPRSSVASRPEARFSTFLARHSEQQKNDAIVKEALAISQSSGLKQALQYLKLALNTNVLVFELAKFLYLHHAQIDSLQLGDLLASGGDSLLSAQEYLQLRTEYVSLFEYTDVQFSDALRQFLTESGFRLPGEAQKVDRMLEAFCTQYVTTNPTVFDSASSALVLAFALVMLNTDLHDSRLNATSTLRRRKLMTVSEFVHNLRGTNNGSDFSKDLLISLYENILNQAIEWKYTGATTSSSMENRKMSTADLQRVRTKLIHRCVKRTINEIRSHIPYQQHFNPTTHTELGLLMFNACWFKCVASIAYTVERLLLPTLAANSTGSAAATSHSNSAAGSHHAPATLMNETEIQLLSRCLDAIINGIYISMAHNMSNALSTQIRLIAQMIYTEKHRYKHRASTIQHRVTANEHVKQPWLEPLLRQCTLAPGSAVDALHAIVSDLKMKVAVGEIHLCLRQWQTRLNNDIHLTADRHRRFIRTDSLIKRSAVHDLRDQAYEFILFNDLLIYASTLGSIAVPASPSPATPTTPVTTASLKPHRVLLHALTTIQDVPETSDSPRAMNRSRHSLGGISEKMLTLAFNSQPVHAVKLVNPQKTIIVVFTSRAAKQEWVAALAQLLSQATVVQQRERILERVYSDKPANTKKPDVSPHNSTDTLNPNKSEHRPSTPTPAPTSQSAEGSPSVPTSASSAGKPPIVPRSLHHATPSLTQQHPSGRWSIAHHAHTLSAGTVTTLHKSVPRHHSSVGDIAEADIDTDDSSGDIDALLLQQSALNADAVRSDTGSSPEPPTPLSPPVSKVIATPQKSKPRLASHSRSNSDATSLKLTEDFNHRPVPALIVESMSVASSPLDVLSPRTRRRSTEDQFLLQKYTSTMRANHVATKTMLALESKDSKHLNKPTTQPVQSSTLPAALTPSDLANATNGTLGGPDTAVSAQSQAICRLCIRAYSMFRRKARCRSCQQSVCTDCGTHRATLANAAHGEQHYVCDACYGVLTGIVK